MELEPHHAGTRDLGQQGGRRSTKSCSWGWMVEEPSMRAAGHRSGRRRWPVRGPPAGGATDRVSVRTRRRDGNAAEGEGEGHV